MYSNKQKGVGFVLKLSWLISLGISLIGFLVIEHFFTIQPEKVSGSGNLGAVGITLILPFLLLSLLTTCRYFLVLFQNTIGQINKIITVISGFILIGIFIYFSIDYKNDVINSLNGPTWDPESEIYGLPTLNQYTNHIFFNFYTFALVHTISGTIGTIIGILKREKEKKEFPQ